MENDIVVQVQTWTGKLFAKAWWYGHVKYYRYIVWHVIDVTR